MSGMAKTQGAWGIYDREGNLVSICALLPGLTLEQLNRGEHTEPVHVCPVSGEEWGRSGAVDSLHPRYWL